MNCRKSVRVIFCLFVLQDVANCLRFGTSNITAFHDRQKRYLVFPMRGGLFKMIMGFGVPVAIGRDRSLGFGYNMQFQYSIPPSIQSLAAIYTPVTYVRKRREMAEQRDTSREYLYLFIETLLDIRGLDGRSCLLRTICESAEAPVSHDGLIGELIHEILTPDKNPGPEDIIMVEYSEARIAGEAGAHCRSLYPECPPGRDMLDAVSLIDNFLQL